MAEGLKIEQEIMNQILTTDMDHNTASLYRLTLDNCRKIMEYSKDIAEVTLNRTVEEITTSVKPAVTA